MVSRLASINDIPILGSERKFCWMLGGRIQRTYRVRVALFVAGTVLLLLLLGDVYQGIQTLNALDHIESERDRWQRPSDVIHALNVHDGSVVLDIGSGVGYFALKLSPVVGKRGIVVAEDIRRESFGFPSDQSVRAKPPQHQDYSRSD